MSWHAYAVDTAEMAGLNPLLVKAIAQVESAWNTWAARYEPLFSYYYHAPEMADQLGLSVETEKACQRTSWGLLQIMGGVARERGFRDHLTQLCDPMLGLKYGCAQLKWLSQFAREEAELIAMYNGGRGARERMPSGMFRNQRYVDKVCKELNELRKLKG